MTIQWPLSSVTVTGEWANSPEFYSQFGQAGHNGIDLAASVGTPVYATDGGFIAAEGWGDYDNWMGSIAGIFVRIQHAWGYSAYAHLSTTLVNAGQWVDRGQIIGFSGATGVGTGPHLHFETFPLYPNFSNGFAGRVNPRSWGLVGRGEAPKPDIKPTPAAQKSIDTGKIRRSREEDTMIYIYLTENKKTYYAVFNLGVKGSWWQFTGQQSANQLATQRGGAMGVVRSTWDDLKARHK